MPKPDQLRTVEEIRAERDKIQTAAGEVRSRLAELEEAITSGSVAELEAREESLRKGRPAKPDKKLRALRDDAADLQDQLKTADLLLARLDLEYLEAQTEGVQAEKAEATRKVGRITEEMRAVEARLHKAGVEAQGARDHERVHRDKIKAARDKLYGLDPAEAERTHQEYKQRLAKVSEGHQRQHGERVEQQNAAIEKLQREGKISAPPGSGPRQAAR